MKLKPKARDRCKFCGLPHVADPAVPECQSCGQDLRREASMNARIDGTPVETLTASFRRGGRKHRTRRR